MVKSKILGAIKRLNLNLQGKVVLTEAATGPYSVTAIIAALAGAKVFAYTKETKYGSVNQVRRELKGLVDQFGDNRLDINIIDELTPQIIFRADIITNSGHLRPLNEDLLSHAKPGVVIPLMYETWELRPDDVDVKFCSRNSISLAGTNERHSDVGIFDYLPEMVIKLIHDSGLSLLNNKFILICNNDFGAYISRGISGLCEKLAVCDLKGNKSKYDLTAIDWIGDFPKMKIPNDYRDCAGIIWATFPLLEEWIGTSNEPFQVKDIISAIDSPLILRVVGQMNETRLNEFIHLFPRHVDSGHMGVLPSAIGHDPIIRLQAAGLKVGELQLEGEQYFNEQILAEYFQTIS
ncbi:MAG: hypothetical protein ABJF04_14650 [Reichenbachiella sp.]|uniref:hypothetical protein n=1 Tax=Reichenbachiella sp. TaxID=2184521 RepID=UPI003266E585